MSNAQSIESIKREAKRLSRSAGITHSQALDVLAVQAGFTHWGSYQASILKNMNRPPVADSLRVEPAALLGGFAAAIGGFPDVVREARHVVVSGGTSTGKTTFVRRMLSAVREDATIVMLESYREIYAPRTIDGMIRTTNGMPPPDEWDASFATAKDRRPDVVVFGEVSTSSGETVLRAMRMEDGPCVVTTIHARDVEEARRIFADRTGGDAPAPTDRVCCVQMFRDDEGLRRISGVAMM